MGKRGAEGEPLGLFAGFGVEIEYMLVRNDDLSVLPVTDQVLKAISGEYLPEVELGELAWSNELALHVIELKTNGPAPGLVGLDTFFERDLARINGVVAPLGGRLMPTAMHPWMDPLRETQLWPHEYSPIYEAFNRIFNCQGHGWSNLQSVHVNLPFANDAEFGQLHAAIRLLLPLMPGLAASSPIIDGRVTSTMDNRLRVYRDNARKIPSVTGAVIPEAVFTRRDYEAEILGRIYHDLSPYDTEGVLRHEWVNARGAIARFDRNTIEIRVLDTQECPRADLAIAAAIVETIRAMIEGLWIDSRRQRAWQTERLQEIFLATTHDAELTLISNRSYLEAFGFPEGGRCRVGELWQHLIETVFQGRSGEAAPWREAWDVLLGRGTLARRIVRALGSGTDRAELASVYRRLCDCLSSGTLFVA